jgi:hypothetical protein
MAHFVVYALLLIMVAFVLRYPRVESMVDGGDDDIVQAAQTNAVDAPPGRFPWVVYVINPVRNTMGTGFLITPVHVMTARHVVEGTAEVRMVIGGVTGTTKDGEGRKGFVVAKGVNNFDDDWAIVRLRTASAKPPVAVDGFTAKWERRNSVGALFKSIGYGLDETGNPAPRLQLNTLKITAWRPTSFLATGVGPVSVCFGDSGGPNFVTVNGQDIVIGITMAIDAVTLKPGERWGGKPHKCLTKNSEKPGSLGYMYFMRTTHAWKQARKAFKTLQKNGKQKSYVDMINSMKCRFTDRVNKRCPREYPWDTGTVTRTGRDTPAGYINKHCAKGPYCATLMNLVYDNATSRVFPIRKMFYPALPKYRGPAPYVDKNKAYNDCMRQYISPRACPSQSNSCRQRGDAKCGHLSR